VTPRYAAALVSAILALAPGCHRDGCVGGDDGTCMPPAACPALKYEKTCAASPTVSRIVLDDALNGGTRDPKARGTAGDIVLANDLVRVVLSAPSHASDLAPTGGAIIDLSLVGVDSPGDQLNSIYQAAGLLPRDAVHYESKKFDEGDNYVAVVFRGHLESDRKVTVVTRYEVRACEPGVRVRSDLYNGASDPNTLFLADGLFWGDHAALPFVPGVGRGFRAPEVNLRDVASAWAEWPFVAARPQASPDVSYAVVPCDPPQAAGFNDPTLTASGLPLTTILPGDGVHLERFIVAKGGPGLADAVGEALRVRARVHGEAAPVTLTGRVVAGGTPIKPETNQSVSLLFYEPAFGPDPDDPARRTPWSEAVAKADGTFTVVLPPNRSYRVQPYAFGLPAATPTSFAVAQDAVDIGDITLTASAHLKASVTTVAGQAPGMNTFAELVIVPVDPPPTDAPRPSMYGLFPGCDPMLGPPHGGSPACNRTVTRDSTFSLLIPPGAYYVYATRGPFASIDRAEITVAAGGVALVSPLVAQSLPLLPDGALSGDFHVHGGASFDSAITDQVRVASFLAAGVDVVIATDHDVVTSYQDVLHGFGDVAERRLALISGVEQTPNIPWLAVPGNDLPATVGHFNFWPLVPDSTLPGNGAPWDELREPGQMMDDMDALFAPPSRLGVRQLNHPFAEAKLGRDQGFMRAIGYDPRKPIAPGASFAADMLLSVPGGPGHHSNLDWDVQEVMTGASVANWLRYRALWFSMLSQGIVRAGTANSDTHSLSLEQVGYPRNIVFGKHQRDMLDVDRFDDDIRRGHMQGTNGPVLDVTIEDRGTIYQPGLDPIHPSPDAQLVILVSAAPWIPVTQARIIVNGVTVDPPIAFKEFVGVDHFATQAVHTARRAFPLSKLLPKVQPDPQQAGKAMDAWLIVEAGLELPDATDVDGDGLPDLVNPDIAGRPDSKDDPRFDYQAIAPGSWPVAFTNPFLIDVDGGGWQAPGLP
jgi:hypothetical protein